VGTRRGRDLRTLPKAHLHLHFTGSMRHATLLELAELILDEAEVAVVPGEAFGSPGYVRLSYALGDDDIAEGVGRLAALLAEAT